MNFIKTIQLLCILSLGLNLKVALGQSSPYAKTPQLLPIPASMEDVEVMWVTVGLGKHLHARYGHTFLKFVLREYPQPWIYNWGMFSFQDPLFPINFYLGHRQYWVGNMDERQLKIFYERHEDRNVWQQKISLTTSQKKHLIELVNESLQPDRMFFRYEHFSANCATIPRDLLNQVLGGYLKRELSKQAAPVNFRYYVTEHMAFYPPLGFLLDLAMNSLLDGELTLWQESFYPLRLAEFLSSLPAVDDQGNPIPESSLLGPSQSMVQASSEHNSQKGFFGLFFLLTWLISLLVIGAFSLLQKKPPTTARLWGLYSVLWGLFSGGVGLIMVISWMFSTHYDMHHNLNLWLLFPTDFLFVYWGLKALRGKPWKKWLLSYSSIRLSMLALYLLISLSGLSTQDISTALKYVLPIQVVYLALGLLYKKEEEALNTQSFFHPPKKHLAQ